MGNLPTSRTITLAPDDDVPSALLDELQDMVIIGAHKEFSLSVHPCDGHGTATQLSNKLSFYNGAGNWHLPLGLMEGLSIRQIIFNLFGNGVSDFTDPITLSKMTKAGVVTTEGSIGAGTLINIPAASTEYFMIPAAPVPVNAGDLFDIAFGNTNGAGIECWCVQLFVSRL